MNRPMWMGECATKYAGANKKHLWSADIFPFKTVICVWKGCNARAPVAAVRDKATARLNGMNRDKPTGVNRSHG